MTYAEVYNIVGYFAPKVMPIFADGWGRFPEGEHAVAVAKELLAQADFWESRHTPVGNENAEQLSAAGLAVLEAAGLPH